MRKKDLGLSWIAAARRELYILRASPSATVTTSYHLDSLSSNIRFCLITYSRIFCSFFIMKASILSILSVIFWATIALAMPNAIAVLPKPNAELASGVTVVKRVGVAGSQDNAINVMECHWTLQDPRTKRRGRLTLKEPKIVVKKNRRVDRGKTGTEKHVDYHVSRLYLSLASGRLLT
jgi:hypothetical protein